jgi:hypothetical protein
MHVLADWAPGLGLNTKHRGAKGFVVESIGRRETHHENGQEHPADTLELHHRQIWLSDIGRNEGE